MQLRIFIPKFFEVQCNFFSQESAPKPIPVLICGNKVDLRIAAAADGLRCISTEEGQKLAKTFKALFFEVSAKMGTNIVDVMLTLARY